MAYTTINKSTDHFNTKLYTGDGSTSNSITGVGFQPDWIWIKKRNSSASHRLLDSIRGVQKHLASDNTDAEVTQNSVMSFDTDGFTVGNSAGTNGSSDTFASWNWKANGGTTSSNTDGSITSTVQANTTAGFSIVTYTGSGSNATVGHGLGSVPQVVIVKDRTNNIGNTNWNVYHAGNTSAPATEVIALNSDSATSDSNIYWNDTAPTSSVFSLGTAGQVNDSSDNYVAYCFAEKTGYSKFGFYTSNGNADGPFIYTGFKPAWVMLKNTSSTAAWMLYDNKRDADGNPNTKAIVPNLSNVEDVNAENVDFLSNGFKCRSTGVKLNNSTNKFIYWAFAEAPLVGTNNIPATAK